MTQVQRFNGSAPIRFKWGVQSLTVAVDRMADGGVCVTLGEAFRAEIKSQRLNGKHRYVVQSAEPLTIESIAT